MAQPEWCLYMCCEHLDFSRHINLQCWCIQVDGSYPHKTRFMSTALIYFNGHLTWRNQTLFEWPADFMSIFTSWEPEWYNHPDCPFPLPLGGLIATIDNLPFPLWPQPPRHQVWGWHLHREIRDAHVLEVRARYTIFQPCWA